MDILTNELMLLALMAIFIIAVPLNLALYVYSTRTQRYQDEQRWYNRDLQRAEYNEMRSYFERKINELENRLVSDSTRWREIFQLQISAQNFVPPAGSISQLSSKAIPTTFFENMGISVANVQIDESLVFVLTPYSNEEVKTYEVIKDVCSSVGLRCLRGDEEFMDQRDILSHILKNLVKARIVIANINGRNPNVFYELGIAHAISKPTILVGKSLTEAPFDIQSKRIILYENESELNRVLSLELTRTVLGQDAQK